jgi:hypothetical protein
LNAVLKVCIRLLNIVTNAWTFRITLLKSRTLFCLLIWMEQTKIIIPLFPS